PLFANVSAIYLGALLYLIAIALTLHLTDSPFKLALLHGLAYAGLASFKPNLALFVPFQYLSFCFALPRKQRVSYALAAPLSSALFAAPWFGTHFEKFASLVGNRGTLAPTQAPSFLNSEKWIFDTENMFFGFSVTPLHYGGLALIVLSAATIGMVSKKRSLPRSISFPAAICSVFFLVLVSALSGRVLESDSIFRYFLPTFLSSVFVISLLLPSQRESLRSALPSLITLSIVIFSFTPSLISRLSKSVNYHNALPLASTSNESYLNYCRFMLSEKGSDLADIVQSATPRDSTILLWTTSSFNFKPHRNRILDMDPAAYIAPWADFPFEEDYDTKLEYLRKLGIHCIIWQNTGGGVREVSELEAMMPALHARRKALAMRVIEFWQFLNQLKARKKVLYEIPPYVVIEIQDYNKSNRD
ncbi:MAG: hypothetical protein AAGB46_15830, partial [Verrucomicrobiota bacterium]